MDIVVSAVRCMDFQRGSHHCRVTLQCWNRRCCLAMPPCRGCIQVLRVVLALRSLVSSSMHHLAIVTHWTDFVIVVVALNTHHRLCRIASCCLLPPSCRHHCLCCYHAHHHVLCHGV